MISNQILQSTIDGLKSISRMELAIMDAEGKELAATCDMKECAVRCIEFSRSPADSQELQGCQYFKIYDEYQLEYILVVRGTGDDAYMVGKMSAFQIQGCWLLTRSALTRIILSRTYCWTTYCWLIFTVVPRSCVCLQIRNVRLY